MMRTSAQRAAINVRALSAVVIILVAVVAGGLLLRGYRKQAAVRHAYDSGLVAYEAGDFSKAVEDLGRYLVADPHNIEIRLKYANAQMRNRPHTEKGIQQAIASLERILRIEPGHPEAAQTLVQLYLLLDAPVEAERVSRNWLEATSDKALANRHLAAALTAQRKNDEAIAILQSLVADQPNSVQLISTLAFLLLRHNNDTDACHKLLDEAIERNPNSTEARIARARFFLATGQHESVDRELREAEKLSSNENEVLLDLARILSALGFRERADAQFDLAEQRNPSDPDVYDARAQIALELGEYEAGAEVMDRALAQQLDERRYDLLFTAIELYANAQRSKDACKCIEELRTAGAPPWNLKYLDALVAISEGRMDEGTASLEEVVRHNAQHTRAQLSLGQAYIATGQLSRAIGPLKEYVRLHRGPAVAVQLQLARIYAALGQWDQAVRMAKEAQSQAPLSLSAELALIEIQAFMAKPDGSQADPAVLARLYKQTQDLKARHPADVRLRVLLARLAAWQDRLSEAREILEVTSKEIEDSQLPIHVALADIYTDVSQYDQAIAECTKALTFSDKAQTEMLKMRLAKLHVLSGDVRHAKELMDEIVAEHSQAAHSAVRLKLARMLLQQGLEAQARECLIQVIAEDDKNIGARLMLLAMKPNEGQEPSRQELVDQLKQIEGDDSLNWRYWQARLWMERNDWIAYRDKVEELLNECLSRNPSWDEVALALGAVYEKTDEPQKAMDVYRQAFQSDSGQIELGRRLLALATREGYWSEVDQLLDELPADDPTLQEYRITQALRRDNTDQAIQMLESRINENAKDFMSRLQLENLVRKVGDTARADHLLAEAVRIAPDALQVLIARVEACLSRSEFQRALDLCDQALAKKPRPEVRTLRARVHEASGNLELAAEDLRDNIQSSVLIEQSYLELGRLYLRHGKRTQAFDVWQEGLNAIPKSFPIRLTMVSAMLANDDEQQRQAAAPILDELLAEYPADEKLLTLKADRLLASEPAEAERIYEEIIQSHPNASDVWVRLAQIASKNGQRERALQYISEGLSHNPQNANLLLTKCDLLLLTSPSRSALAAQEVLDNQPNNEAAVLALARALDQTGDRGQAIEALKVFLTRASASQSIETRLALANLYMKDRKWDQADALIQQASKLNPNDPGPVKARLIWHRAQEQWDSCIALAHDRLKNHPEDITTAQFASHLLMSSNENRHRQAAKDLCQHVIEQRPQDGESYAELGAAFYILGEIDEARSAFERGLQVDPDHVRLLNDLAWLICEDLNDPETAAKWAGKGIESGATAPTLLDTWGVIQYRLGNLQASRQALEKCLSHPQVRQATRLAAKFHLARTLTKEDAAASRRLLDDVLGDSATEKFLPPADRQEARQLWKSLAAIESPGPEKTQ